MTRSQLAVGAIAALLLLGASIAAPTRTVSLLLLVITLAYFVSALYRFWISILGATRGASTPPVGSDDDLPVYTILVPVYREANLMPGLIASISRLDYPPDRLDVIVLLEPDDLETRQVLDALAPPEYIRQLVVPDIGPKGKPRACNAGLAQARGELLVIYDAEDAPEPDQLRKAVAAFRAAGPELACVQCKLDFFNADENLLTRWFASEYAVWFDLYLPGLQRAGVPIPLGGTSNHFSTETLRDLGGWDPYNVTEDADLGMRLARAGFKTSVIDSITWEEANSQPRNWIRQRSRWIKGYAVTWLVQMRHPWRLCREVGPRGFLSVQLTLGMSVAMALINPIFWLLTLGWLLTRAEIIEQFFSGPTFYIGSASLFLGNWVLIMTAMVGCYRRGHFSAIKSTLLLPLYWAMMSAAAWKGLFQIFRRPAYWEKTDHGLTLIERPFAPTPTSDISSVVPWRRGARVRTAPGARREPVVAASSVRLLTRVDAAIWLGFSVLAVAGGLWAALHQHAHHGDALARTYAAVQVVDGYEPKLANLGLVWPVLPTLLQLPIAAIAPGLAANGAVGPIISGIAFGACVMLLNRILRYYVDRDGVRRLMLALFFANPLILQLTTSGLSEMVFVSFLLLGWWGIEVATRDHDRVLTGTLIAALGAGGAFSSRYEGGVFGLALLASLVGLLVVPAWKGGQLRRAFPAIEASAVIFLTCFGYVVALFFFFNYTIMGDLFYFANGPGSNAKWMQDFFLNDRMIASMVGDPAAAVAYAARGSWFVFAATAITLPVAAWFILRVRDVRLFFLLAIVLATPAQQALLIFQGQSPAWRRFYIAGAFFGIILIAYLARLVLERSPQSFKRTVTAGSLALILASTSVAWQSIDDRRIADDFWDGYIARAFTMGQSNTFTNTDDARRMAERIIAPILDAHPNLLILVDDLTATLIILFSGHPENFVVPNVHQFEEFLGNPVGNVQYILVSDSATRNLILDAYPYLITEGAPFATLVATYREETNARTTWYLFEVDGPSKMRAERHPGPRSLTTFPY